MKIRSITYFLNPGWPLNETALQDAGDFIQQARSAFTSAGYEVQTVRLATVPFPQLISTLEGIGVLEMAKRLEQAAGQAGITYVSMGPALPEAPESYGVISDVLEATQNVFLSGMMASPARGISLPAVRACAEVIYRAARVTPDGFTNLRFTATANVPPGAPFFPASYHEGESPRFAIATESADLAYDAVAGAHDLMDARERFMQAVRDNATRLEATAQALEDQFSVEFGGIDFSLATFPEESRSLGSVIEKLGAPKVGLAGSLAAAAFLADALDRVPFRRAGLSGLFFPVLEDSLLAQRAAEGVLSVTDLLLYSAVCGTGLDTIPLPGNTTPEQLAAVLLDVAALAQRLDKPLTARLMPVPGKKAGDPTHFDFAYFANSRVLSLEAQPLHGLFAAETSAFALLRRKRNDSPA